MGHEQGSLRNFCQLSLAGFKSVQDEVSEEVQSHLRLMSFGMDMENMMSTRWERISYMIENFVSTHPNGYFWILSIFTLILMLILGLFWFYARVSPTSKREQASESLGVAAVSTVAGNATAATTTDTELSDGEQYGLAVWQVFQVIAAGGVDDSIVEPAQIMIYTLILLTGLIVFAILIGMITDSFQSYVESMSEGKTKVPISNHTLILGWNEATLRVVCQLALIRRQYQMQNETCVRTIFWWRRVSPSTPVADAPIVLMNNQKTKIEMQQEINEALSEAGISKKRTRVGRDIICRVGDPCSVTDLQRVGVHRAKAILLKMTEADREEFQINEGNVCNAKTLRALLALRVALFTSDKPPAWEDLRIVAHLERPSKELGAIQLGEAQGGRPILHVQEMSAFVNSLMFTCVCQPGLAFALLELLSFGGNAFRLRRVVDFPNKGQNIVGKSLREVKMMWENAAVLGVVQDGIHAVGVLPEQGLAVPQDRIIGPLDRIIFICQTSSPMEAKTGTFPEITGKIDHALSPEWKAVNILVCGWRREWDCAARFGKRLRETCSELAPRSRLKFLCMKTSEGEGSFQALMESIMQDDPNLVPEVQEGSIFEWKYNEIRISYTQGNAANYKDLEGLIRRKTYDKAVILSTMADCDLPPMSRDSRILSIMLHLRHLQMTYKKPPIHVIGENALDSTSVLAMGPSSRDTHCSTADLPDFVNVQAIYACALCQSLAYPRLQPHMSQLFSKDPGTPSLRLIDALSVLPAGCYPWGSVVLYVPKTSLDPSDVLIGIRKNSGPVTLVPMLSEEVNFEKGDKLMVISRSLSKFDQEQKLADSSASKEISSRASLAWRPESPYDMSLPGRPVDEP
eukprot:TRINITY_DN26861_c0_g1_i1.p1 TRINITY_DN26861_c0_g1~~TRINITY_DN26861_c0_g1_i1.p1  ORF type:complete len:857 (-),score=140.97 TRINITY_DN26861_c0_g1_i1:89-2659(-)